MRQLGLEQFRQQFQRRYERLYDAEPALFHWAHRQFWQWLESEPLGARLLIQLEHEVDSLGVDQRLTAKGLIEGRRNLNPDGKGRPYRLALAWAVVEQCRDSPPTGGKLPPELMAAEQLYLHFHQYDLNWGTGREREENLWRLFLQRCVEPLYIEITENIAEEALLRYLLSRYVERCSQFDRMKLYNQWNDAHEESKGEYVLAQQLYRYLFDHHLTFAVEPSTNAGRADLLARDEDERYVIEVKVFTETKGPADVARWFSQLHAYAEDHDAPSAFLVVFNTQERPLSLPSQVTTEELGGLGGRQRVYDFVVVDIYPDHPSASKRKKLAPICVGVDDLVE